MFLKYAGYFLYFCVEKLVWGQCILPKSGFVFFVLPFP